MRNFERRIQRLEQARGRVSPHRAAELERRLAAARQRLLAFDPSYMPEVPEPSRSFGRALSLGQALVEARKRFSPVSADS